MGFVFAVSSSPVRTAFCETIPGVLSWKVISMRMLWGCFVLFFFSPWIGFYVSFFILGLLHFISRYHFGPQLPGVAQAGTLIFQGWLFFTYCLRGLLNSVPHPLASEWTLTTDSSVPSWPMVLGKEPRSIPSYSQGPTVSVPQIQPHTSTASYKLCD